jgi:hypothetical protein
MPINLLEIYATSAVSKFFTACAGTGSLCSDSRLDVGVSSPYAWIRLIRTIILIAPRVFFALLKGHISYRAAAQIPITTKKGAKVGKNRSQ